MFVRGQNGTQGTPVPKNKNGFFNKFNTSFKILKQFVDQTVFVAGLIDIQSSDPYPSPAAFFKASLVALLICTGEFIFHRLIDSLDVDNKTNNDESGIVKCKYSLALAAHFLNDALDGAGFVSVVHGGASFYLKHDISLVENICSKTLGTLIGSISAYGETDDLVDKLKVHGLWGNQKRILTTHSVSVESRTLLNASSKKNQYGAV